MDCKDVQLRSSSNIEFFKILEETVHIDIPIQLKKNLKLNKYDNAAAFSRFNEQSIKEVEDFMRNDFTKSMLNGNDSMSHYLDIFSHDQKKFKFLSGQKSTLRLIAEYCHALYPPNVPPRMPDIVMPPQSVSHQPLSQDLLNESEWCSPPQNESGTNDNNHDKLFRLIGGHMINFFNDTKRVTLTAWSWPSREIAAEMAHSFQFNGNSESNFSTQFHFDYLTPHNHAIFLDCIVQSDLEKVKLCLREALAVSLRLDGSVDRTSKHNVYVLAHIVKRDGTLSTLFMGFAIPETGDGEAYLQCLKDVVDVILPWEAFFKLASSIVTDGEYLNTGRFNGLWAKLKEERLGLIPPQLPLLSIWCVPHRINLAWKSVCSIRIIANTIQHCSKLSTYFHNSAVRTNTLKQSPQTNNLNPPLRYPKYFAVRWAEYLFNLLTAVLKNWRAAVKYFELKNLTNLMNTWVIYDRLHLITFLADILSLLKQFQKSCQSDCICILDVLPLKSKFVKSLDICKNGTLQGGWEKLFLENVVTNGNELHFYGIKLTKPIRRSAFSFTSDDRHRIIRSLIQHVNIRINFDASVQKTLQPLAKICSSVPNHDLKLCYSLIASDLDEKTFFSEYYAAAKLLKNIDFDTTLARFQHLLKVSPDKFHTLIIVIARVVAAKPHSADVERLISVYNKFKSCIRSPLSPQTLWNYLYINTNMGCLQRFDPTSAIQYWMNHKRRHPKSSDTRCQQEWFHGVFEEGRSSRKRNISPNIKF